MRTQRLYIFDLFDAFERYCRYFRLMSLALFRNVLTEFYCHEIKKETQRHE